MRRLAAALLLAACLAHPATAKAADPAWPQGLYGSVRMSPETGDLGGMEVRFFQAEGRAMVEAVVCEGWCNETHTAPLERTAQGFAFRYVERYEGGEGVSETAYRVTLTPARRGFRAHLNTEADPATPSWEVDPVLRPLKRAFGLQVAHSEQGATAD